MMSILKNYSFVEILILITVFGNVFRGALAFLGVGFVPVLSAILLLLILLFKKRLVPNNSYVLLFISAGILSTIISVISLNNITIPILAFFATYFNFLIWNQYFIKNKDCNDFISKLNFYVIIFAAISGLLGVYQIFVDVSIGGLASISGIYGDPEVMSSGQHTSRATGLLGSAQNYGVFMGIAFCIGVLNRLKSRWLWIACMICILAGVIVSNSRSASSCVVIALSYGIYVYNKKMKISNASLIVYGIVILAIASFIYITIIADNLELFSRLSNFDNSLARNVYADVWDNFDISSITMGYGMGFRNYSVNSFVGEADYRNVFNEYYTSVESYFLTLFVQGGIFLLLAFIALIVKCIKISFSNYTTPIVLCLMVNMLFTPSMSGVGVSFILWPYIIYNLYCNVPNKTTAYSKFF